MAITKGQIIEDAFAELALAGYVFDLDPEELQGALRTLGRMISTWQTSGLLPAYVATGATEELEEDSGIASGAQEAVVLGLAMRIAASKGKQLSAETRMFAKQAYNTLLLTLAMPEQMQKRAPLPRGAGAKVWRNSRWPFFPDTTLVDDIT